MRGLRGLFSYLLSLMKQRGGHSPVKRLPFGSSTYCLPRISDPCFSHCLLFTVGHGAGRGMCGDQGYHRISEKEKGGKI